jgi:hypothetical protein
MVTPHFRGIFGEAKEFLSGNFENYFFILMNLRVSSDVSIQMPAKMPLFEA